MIFHDAVSKSRNQNKEAQDCGRDLDRYTFSAAGFLSGNCADKLLPASLVYHSIKPKMKPDI
jgi:hypothetical protein